MKSNLQHSQAQEQNVIMTPAQQRNLEILQKPVLELQRFIEAQASQNPLLDIVDSDESNRPESIGEDPDSDLYDEDATATSQQDNSELQAQREFLLNSAPDAIRLGEELINNARLDARNAKIVDAFEAIVENLDSRGFLPEDILPQLAERGFDESDLQEALSLLHESEPSGIGARTLQECFLIQLRKLNMQNTLAYRIIEDNFQLFLKRKVEEIAERENRSIQDIENAISVIAKLNSSPAYEYTVDEEKVLIADLEFFKEDNQWKVCLAKNNIPKLSINNEYRLMASDKTLDESSQKYIKEKIADAKNLIDAIKQRQNTLLKIGKAIIARQPNFFESATLLPMTRQDIANDVGIHATTVGRGIANKNAETPFGIIPLKNFFSTALENNDGEVSSTFVKDRISDIIASEDPQSPLSDSDIADLLAKESIVIARRTVSKYREALAIPTKSMRKRYQL